MSRIALSGIYLKAGAKDFGLVFECSWDVEHGLAVRMSETEATETGNSEIAFLFYKFQLAQLDSA